MSSHRVGYIGVEHHHRDPYFQIADELPVEIIAVCEPGTEIGTDDLAPMQDRPDEVASEDTDSSAVVTDASMYEDPVELIDEEPIDVVWITYANDETPAIVEAAIDAGVHVISEKPIARTADELADAVDAARETGINVVPTFFYRANPIVNDVRQSIADGLLGDIWSVDGRFIASQLAYRDTSHYIYDAARSRGGALQWVGVHWLDMIMYVLDQPITGVYARTLPADQCDVEAGATVQFELQDGTLGTFQNGYYLDERGKDTHLGIYGRQAQVRTPVHHDSMAAERTAPIEITSKRDSWTSAPRRTTQYEFAYDRFPAWGDYVLEFFERCFAGFEEGSPPADADDAHRLLRVLDAVYESADRGQWVDIDHRVNPEP